MLVCSMTSRCVSMIQQFVSGTGVHSVGSAFLLMQQNVNPSSQDLVPTSCSDHLQPRSSCALLFSRRDGSLVPTAAAGASASLKGQGHLVLWLWVSRCLAGRSYSLDQGLLAFILRCSLTPPTATTSPGSAGLGSSELCSPLRAVSQAGL